jgi:ketosteroid isomerase-like protein
VFHYAKKEQISLTDLQLLSIVNLNLISNQKLTMVLFACNKAIETKSEFDLGNAKKEIEAANKNIAELLAKNDSVGFANSYTEDAKFMEHNLPALEGRVAIQSFWSKFMIAGGNDIQLNTLEVWGDAETITEEGLYELKSNTGAVLGKGKYIVIWKFINGKWLIHRDISNSDLPATK